jgi:hypothetical protein
VDRTIPLTAVQFGRKLIASLDLDPVYVALEGVKMPAATRAKLCLAYWCLYHLGAAARIAENDTDAGYWRNLKEAAVNPIKAWPRGSERRHWRGQAAIDSYEALRLESGNASELIHFWAEPKTFAGVSERIRAVRGFGPWIAFKAADMMERCLKYPIDFSECELSIYDEPRKGAALYWRGDEKAEINAEEVRRAANRLKQELGGISAPPDYKRKINIQEVESIFCKWKSYRHGHYWVGKDIQEVRHSLLEWGDLAKQLHKAMPEPVERIDE